MDAYTALESPNVRIVSEMGGSLRTVAYTVELVPETRPHDDGQGYLFALDARTGKVLWKFQTGGGIGASPISYSLDGKQYIAVAAGGAIIAFGIR